MCNTPPPPVTKHHDLFIFQWVITVTILIIVTNFKKVVNANAAAEIRYFETLISQGGLFVLLGDDSEALFATVRRLAAWPLLEQLEES